MSAQKGNLMYIVQYQSRYEGVLIWEDDERFYALEDARKYALDEKRKTGFAHRVLKEVE